jgi:hypothetical protein
MVYQEDEDEDEMDDDYEPTGMLSEFQREAGLTESDKNSAKNKFLSVSMNRRPENSIMQQSLVASFMEQQETENISLRKHQHPKVNENVNRNGQKFDVSIPNLEVSYFFIKLFKYFRFLK